MFTNAEKNYPSLLLSLPLLPLLPLLAIMVLCVCGLVFAQDGPDSCVLLIQQSPVDAGTVSPGLGVYRAEINQTVTLTATPKPGYRFLYWLGDVTDTQANQTTVVVDSPKIVIAIFERSEFEQLPMMEMTSGGGRGGGDFLIAKPIRGGQSGVSPAGLTPKKPPVRPKKEEEPIPEPATLVLLGLGWCVLFRRKPSK